MFIFCANNPFSLRHCVLGAVGGKSRDVTCFPLLLQGYVVRISGGNDKQGFPMKQGVLTHGRVRLLLSKGHSCYRPRRTGERKRKSVRGCIVDANLSVLNLVIVKKGEVLSLAHVAHFVETVDWKLKQSCL